MQLNTATQTFRLPTKKQNKTPEHPLPFEYEPGDWQEIEEKMGGGPITTADIAPEFHRSWSNEQQLWAAVLIRALDDARGNVKCDWGKIEWRAVYKTRVKEEAIDWFASNEVEEGSFCWICQMLNIQPWVFRGMLERNLKGPQGGARKMMSGEGERLFTRSTHAMVRKV